jgi:hypothetical protein
MAEKLSTAEHNRNFPMRVETYTVGKGGEHADPLKNEDVIDVNERGMVIADGSTTKNKELAKKFEAAFDGKSGGRVAAEVVAEAALNSDLDGRALVDHISGRVHKLYEDRFPEALTETGEIRSEMAMATTFARVRYDSETGEHVLTRVGDTSARVKFKNGTQQIFNSERAIDGVDAENRSIAIQEALAAGDPPEVAIPKGREAILPSLNGQAANYWNNPESEYGFGYVTGAHVPDEFIEVVHIPADQIESIELISDGYTYAPPDEYPAEASIPTWEEHIEAVHAADPDKYLQYLSTKPRDDRAIIIGHNDS